MRRGAENEIDPAAGLRPAVVEVMKAKSKDVQLPIRLSI